MKWTMGVNRKQPGYMLREEMGKEKIRRKAGKSPGILRKAWKKEKGDEGKELLR